MNVKSKIIRVEPETEYNGTVYEQNVVIEFQTGTRIGTFDKKALISNEDIGETVDLKLSLPVKDIESNPDEMMAVEPDSESPLSWQNHTYYGELTNLHFKSSNRYKGYLDIGGGFVKVHGKVKNYPDLSEGDYLKFKTFRTDINDVG